MTAEEFYKNFLNKLDIPERLKKSLLDVRKNYEYENQFALIKCQEMIENLKNNMGEEGTVEEKEWKGKKYIGYPYIGECSELFFEIPQIPPDLLTNNLKMSILKEIESLESKVKSDTISSKDFKLKIIDILKQMNFIPNSNINSISKRLGITYSEVLRNPKLIEKNKLSEKDLEELRKEHFL